MKADGKSARGGSDQDDKEDLGGKLLEEDNGLRRDERIYSKADCEEWVCKQESRQKLRREIWLVVSFLPLRLAISYVLAFDLMMYFVQVKARTSESNVLQERRYRSLCCRRDC
jgi:hypothetical protein